MSQPNSNDQFEQGMPSADFQEAPQPPVQYRKPEFNVYSMMLLLSFLFTTTAAIILITNIK